jgi:hypothetical protein
MGHLHRVLGGEDQERSCSGETVVDTVSNDVNVFEHNVEKTAMHHFNKVELKVPLAVVSSLVRWTTNCQIQD